MQATFSPRGVRYLGVSLPGQDWTVPCDLFEVGNVMGG
jgi:hypothetical protein